MKVQAGPCRATAPHQYNPITVGGWYWIWTLCFHPLSTCTSRRTQHGRSRQRPNQAAPHSGFELHRPIALRREAESHMVPAKHRARRSHQRTPSMAVHCVPDGTHRDLGLVRRRSAAKGVHVRQVLDSSKGSSCSWESLASHADLHRRKRSHSRWHSRAHRGSLDPPRLSPSSQPQEGLSADLGLLSQPSQGVLLTAKDSAQL